MNTIARPGHEGPSRECLTELLLQSLRIARQRGEELDHVRAMYRFAADVATDMGRELDAVRTQNQHLRLQLRAAVSGRTMAVERQQFEREAIEPDYSDIEHALVVTTRQHAA